jgi:hypothetical protein
VTKVKNHIWWVVILISSGIPMRKIKKGVNRFSGIFNSIISSQELIDLQLAGGKFTWSNNQNPPTLEKLDRVLISKEWEDIFPTCMVYKLPREISDHNPLILSTNINSPLKHLSFRYELSWAKHPDILHNVQRIWEGTYHADCALSRIQMKLKKIKQFLKGWGFNNQGEQKNKKRIAGGTP